VRIPDDVRETVYDKVRADAEELDWMALPAQEKSRLYSSWAQDAEVGTVLLGFMSMSQVHRYIKDTLIKTYAQNKISDPATALPLLGLPPNTPQKKQYIKPPGVLLDDRRVIAWSIAKDWKTTLFAVYERAYEVKRATPHAAVLFGAEGRFADTQYRTMVHDAATRLGIANVVWNPL